MTMLTFEESVTFVENDLEVKDVSRRLQQEPKFLLNDIVKALHIHAPFQNLTHLSKTPDVNLRAAPTAEENLVMVKTKIGGLCWTMNCFAYYLLNALNYDVISVDARVFDKRPGDHIVVLVKNLSKQGDLHLVDVGFGPATFEAIDLSDLGRVHSFSFSTLKYIKEGETYIRLHKKSENNPPPGCKIIGDWEYWYYFEAVETDLADIRENIDEHVYRNHGFLFNTAFIFAGWQKNGRAVCIRNDTVLLEGEDNKLHPCETSGKETITKTLQEYFPQFSCDLIDQMFSHCEWLGNSPSKV